MLLSSIIVDKRSKVFLKLTGLHFKFVFIHPYMDGNGRMGRFLLNVMLASEGYPWTVIPVEERKQYMESLEKASVDQDIEAFAKFIAYLVDGGLKGTPVAKIYSFDREKQKINHNLSRHKSRHHKSHWLIRYPSRLNSLERSFGLAQDYKPNLLSK